VCRPGATGVSLCTMETVALPNIQRELTPSFGAKLPWEGGSVADSIRGNLYCLARELAFWWCGRVSFLITQVKQRWAWSVLGWVIVTRYITFSDPFVKTLDRHLRRSRNEKSTKRLWITYIAHVSRMSDQNFLLEICTNCTAIPKTSFLSWVMNPLLTVSSKSGS
jgi:hypothetical protein